MNPSLSALQERIVRYLLIRGEPIDFGAIRQELAHIARARVWDALRDLVDSRRVAYAYRTEGTDFHGFHFTMTFPVFWVNRDALVKDGPSRPADRSEWWSTYLRSMPGKGVQS